MMVSASAEAGRRWRSPTDWSVRESSVNESTTVSSVNESTLFSERIHRFFSERVHQSIFSGRIHLRLLMLVIQIKSVLWHIPKLRTMQKVPLSNMIIIFYHTISHKPSQKAAVSNVNTVKFYKDYLSPSTLQTSGYG